MNDEARKFQEFIEEKAREFDAKFPIEETFTEAVVLPSGQLADMPDGGIIKNTTDAGVVVFIPRSTTFRPDEKTITEPYGRDDDKGFTFTIISGNK